MLSTATQDKLYKRIHEQYAVHFKDIIQSSEHLEQMSRDSLCPKRAIEALSLLEQSTGVPLRGQRMLEVGAGMCMSLATARMHFGADAHGIEPGEDEYSGSLEIGRELLNAVGQPQSILKVGFGEAIPHPSDSFDLVFSYNVLEHTADPEKVIAESIRVLRPGGMLCHMVPNYGSWWEGHYGILWIPFLNKFLGRIYLRLLGKKPEFLDTLQLITRPWLRRMLAPHQDQIEILDWGQDLFVKRLSTLEFSEYAALGSLKRKLKILRLLGMTRLLCALGRLFHWETPFVLVVRKKSTATKCQPVATAA